MKTSNYRCPNCYTEERNFHALGCDGKRWLIEKEIMKIGEDLI